MCWWLTSPGNSGRHGAVGYGWGRLRSIHGGGTSMRSRISSADGAGPPGRAPRRLLLHYRTWGALTAAVLGIGLVTPGTSLASSTPPAATAGGAAVISEWNAIAVAALAGDTATQPVEDILYTAFVQAAVYNAVVGVEGRYEPYRFHDRAPRGASAQAAAVAAAHQVLVTYVPSAQAALDARYAASLAQIPDGTAKTQGIAFGTRAADSLIRLRANDGRNAPIVFAQPPAPGVWRPTPPGSPMSAPWLGFVAPLLVRSATQFAPPPPPTLTSARYTRDFAEVKALGSVNSTVRTPAQTSRARCCSGDALVQYDAALRDQVSVRHLDIVDAARMFAAIDMSAADALISVWHAKYIYGLWRPITAINLADTDGNPATSADTAWAPMITTPPYPEYPSGYNAFNSTVAHGLKELFGAWHLQLTLTTTAPSGGERHYDCAGALLQDVVDARVWQGIHFRTADTAAKQMGGQLAAWTLDRYFQPIHEDR